MARFELTDTVNVQTPVETREGLKLFCAPGALVPRGECGENRLPVVCRSA